MKKRNKLLLGISFVLFLIIAIILVMIYQIQNGMQLEAKQPGSYVVDGLKSVNQPTLDDQLLGIDNPGSDFAYRQLNEEEQVIYKQIASAIYRFENKVKINYADDLTKIYRAVLMDHPEYFWSGDSYIAWGNADTNYIYSIDLSYNVGKLEKAWNQHKIDEAVNQCIAGVDPQASDYEKAKYVYEYVIKTVDYVDTSIQNQNIQSVFLYQESVCAGYAKAAQLLLNRLGIFATYVVGDARLDGASSSGNGSFGHAWNLIEIGGEYYYMDPTWGDPVFSKEAFSGEGISYDYLCITTQELLRSRDIDPIFTMPECNSITYNYYVQEQRYLESFEEVQFLDTVKNEISNGRYELAYKFANKQIFEEAYQKFIEQKKIEEAVQHYLSVTRKVYCNYLYIKDDQIYTLKILIE